MDFLSLLSLCSSLLGQRDEGGSSPAPAQAISTFSVFLTHAHTHTQQRQITHCSISSTNTSPQMTNLLSNSLFSFSLPQLLLVCVFSVKTPVRAKGIQTVYYIISCSLFLVLLHFIRCTSGVKFYPTFMK